MNLILYLWKTQEYALPVKTTFVPGKFPRPRITTLAPVKFPGGLFPGIQKTSDFSLDTFRRETHAIAVSTTENVYGTGKLPSIWITILAPDKFLRPQITKRLVPGSNVWQGG